MFRGTVTIRRTTYRATLVVFALGLLLIAGVIVASFLAPPGTLARLAELGPLWTVGRAVVALGYVYLISWTLRPTVRVVDLAADATGVSVGGAPYLARSEISRAYLRAPHAAQGVAPGSAAAAALTVELVTTRGMIVLATGDSGQSAHILTELGFPLVTVAANQPAPGASEVAVAGAAARPSSAKSTVIVVAALVGVSLLSLAGVFVFTYVQASQASSAPAAATRTRPATPAAQTATPRKKP